MPNGKFIKLLFGALLGILSIISTFSRNTCFAKEDALKTNTYQAPYVLVIDPGHGGADTGALAKTAKGKKTIYEKDISLAIAIRVARLLNNPIYKNTIDRNLEIIFTRKNDRFVSLEERSEIAKKNKADLFVSIHANFDTSKKAHGLEIYFLNNTDTKSDSKLEQIENKHRRKQHDPTSLMLRSVAADAIVESSKLAAETIRKSLMETAKRENLPLEDRGLKQALLYVLLDAQVPAVLLEMGFLSSPSDLALLTQPAHREQMAEGIAKGILRFLLSQ